MVFFNGWYVLIVINDVLALAGTVLKTLSDIKVQTAELASHASGSHCESMRTKNPLHVAAVGGPVELLRADEPGARLGESARLVRRAALHGLLPELERASRLCHVALL